jgi:uncharacterized protein (DUF362 family)
MDKENMERREFIKRTLPAVGLSIAAGGLGFLFHNRNVSGEAITEPAKNLNFSVPYDKNFPQMVIVKGDSPKSITEAAIDALGGIDKFISKDDIVVIKPNIGWDRVPEQAANTNPEVVGTVIGLCLKAGAKKVIVTDVSCNEYKRCFIRSGIYEAVEKAGGIIEIPEEMKFKDTNLGGEVLGTRPVYSVYFEANKVINIPIAKHHSLPGATLGMKNWYGILGGRRNQLHQHIHESIADLANFIKPSLVIMDAYRVLLRNGPQGGNLSDVMDAKTVIAGIDQVAIDAYTGETFFNLTPQQLRYLELAHKKNIGNMFYRELNSKEIII